jgi:pyruvate/2-oxoglutarate dehydrogenase complex dihydrolipoamide acyltransferase (E2) component
MANEFTLPSLGDNVKAGDVLRVLVKAGDVVAVDQAVLELETDKATVEVPSSIAGTVAEVRVKDGDRNNVGQVVFTVTGEGAAAAPVATAAAAPAPAEPAPTPPPAAAAPAPSAPTGGGRIEVAVPSLGENVKGGDVLKVLVKVGDAVSQDQGILELETDKATVEVPSPSAGTVKEVSVKDGDKVAVGQVVLVLDGAVQTASAPPATVAAVQPWSRGAAAVWRRGAAAPERACRAVGAPARARARARHRRRARHGQGWPHQRG